MRTHNALHHLVVIVSLCILSGCADNSADGLMRQQIAKMNELADGLAAGKTPDDLKSVADEMAAINEKLEAMNLSQEEKDALKERHKDELEVVQKKIMSSAMEGMGAQMGNAMEKMGAEAGNAMSGAMEDAMNDMKGKFGK